MHRITLLALAAIASPALADESAIEITPFAGYRFGGNFDVDGSDLSYEVKDSPSFGIAVNFPHRQNTQWEVYYSQQSTDAELNGVTNADPSVDVDLYVLQLGGIYQWEGDTVRPYLAATLGGTHIRTSSSGSESDTFFSGSIGLGIKILPTARVGIRLEARALGTFFNDSTDLFCRTGPDANVCAVRVEGDMLTQIETFAGLTFRF